MDDMQMIALILNKLPSHLCSMFISNFNLHGYTNMSLHIFQNKLRDFWLQNVKSKLIEIAMSVEHKEKVGSPSRSLEDFSGPDQGIDRYGSRIEVNPAKERPSSMGSESLYYLWTNRP